MSSHILYSTINQITTTTRYIQLVDPTTVGANPEDQEALTSEAATDWLETPCKKLAEM